MKARILIICVAVLLIAAGYVWGNRSIPVVHAQANVTVPKVWGHVVTATATGQLIFEDASGTVRWVSSDGSIALQMNRN